MDNENTNITNKQKAIQLRKVALTLSISYLIYILLIYGTESRISNWVHDMIVFILTSLLVLPPIAIIVLCYRSISLHKSPLAYLLLFSAAAVVIAMILLFMELSKMGPVFK